MVAGGAGGALIHLQAKGQQRQPLHGFTVPYLVISAGLPETAVPECGGDLPVRLCILGLVQAPAPQQQRGRANLPPLGARVYETRLQCQHWNCSRNTRCWRQPEVVWINLLPAEYDVQMDQQRSANLSIDSKKMVKSDIPLRCKDRNLHWDHRWAPRYGCAACDL